MRYDTICGGAAHQGAAATQVEGGVEAAEAETWAGCRVVAAAAGLPAAESDAEACSCQGQERKTGNRVNSQKLVVELLLLLCWWFMGRGDRWT